MKKILLFIALLSTPLLKADKPKPTPINHGLSPEEEADALARIAERLPQQAPAPQEENNDDDDDDNNQEEFADDDDQEEFADDHELTLHEALIGNEEDPETLAELIEFTDDINSFYQPEGVDPDDEDANQFTGLTAMAIAARQNNVAALNALSQARANINLPSRETRYTPFYDAITTESNDAITWFIGNNQTNLTLENNQETPFMTLLRMLHEVIEDKRQTEQANFYFTCLTSLLERMDINKTNSIGQTPLIYAVQRNFNPRIITYLLDKGADKTATWKGKTALHIAKKIKEENGSNKLVDLLENYTPQGEQQTKRGKKDTVRDKRKYQDDDTGGNDVSDDDAAGMA